jgi:hypothetical protein
MRTGTVDDLVDSIVGAPEGSGATACYDQEPGEAAGSPFAAMLLSRHTRRQEFNAGPISN